jgi:hypothetical protein
LKLLLTVGSSGGAAVGIVTELMDVHATLSAGIVTSDIPRDGGGRGLRVLLESDGSSDLGVTSDLCNCRQRITCQQEQRKEGLLTGRDGVLSKQMLGRNEFRL